MATIIGPININGFNADNRGYLVECSCGEMAAISERALAMHSYKNALCFTCAAPKLYKDWFYQLESETYSNQGFSILQELGYNCEQY